MRGTLLEDGEEGAEAWYSRPMPRHVVRPGDCVASLAARYRTSVADIWDDPANAALRRQRSSPYLLQPGDLVELPEAAPSRVRVSPGANHRLATEGSQVRLFLKLFDERFEDDAVAGEHQLNDGGARMREADAPSPPRTEALANVPYRLLAGSCVVEGTTDGEGRIDQRIDARLTSVRLILEPGNEHERSLEVKVGHLDPAEADEGIAQRLTNLGFPCAHDRGVEAAVAGYQRSRGIDASGRLDDATRSQLLDESGG